MRVKLILLSTTTFCLLTLPFIPERFIVSLFAQSVPTAFYILMCSFGIVITIHEYKALKWYISCTIGLIFYIFYGITLLAFPNLQSLIPDESKHSFSIAVWNTHYWDQNKDPKQLYSVLKALDSDVLLLQEHIYWSDELKKKLPANDVSILKRCCGFSQIIKKGELIVASRLPVSNVLVDAPYIQKVDLLDTSTNQPIFSIENTHIPVQYDITSPPWERSFWTHMISALDTRQSTFNALLHLADNPVFIGGDFNSTILSPEIRTLASLFTTVTFRPSFPQNQWIPPLWSIDHVFYSKNTKVNCRLVTPSVLSIPIPSDHLPIRCVVVI